MIEDVCCRVQYYKLRHESTYGLLSRIIQGPQVWDCCKAPNRLVVRCALGVIEDSGSHQRFDRIGRIGR